LLPVFLQGLSGRAKEVWFREKSNITRASSSRLIRVRSGVAVFGLQVG